MSRESSEVYEFAGYRLDVDERTFERIDGVKNGNLPEKAFQTLIVLVRNHGRLVSKQELLDSVWPDSYVEENNLDKCIHAIRHALGEKPGEDKYVETVRKHGYRFVADVELVNGKPSSNEGIGADEKRDQAAVATVDRSKLRWVALASGLALIVIVAAVFAFLPRSSNVKHSIAVLPFKPVNTAASDDAYDIGLPDSLIHRLSAMPGLTVRSLNEIRLYRAGLIEPLAAGKEQEVDYVLASNYQISDGRIRISSQLINVTTGQIEDTRNFEKSTADLFALQDAAASELAGAITRRFGLITDEPKPPPRGTSNEEAYRLYLTGANLLSRRGGLSSAGTARQYFEQALTLDPNYAQAWAGSARLWLSNPTDRAADAEKARRAIDRALAIEPMLPEAYDARMMLKFYFERDFEGAEADALMARSLSPNVGEFCSNYAFVLLFTGRVDEAVEEMKRAIDLAPASVAHHRNYGIVLFYARRYDEAIAQLTRVAAMDPNFGSAKFWLWLSYEQKGDYEMAYATYMDGIAEPFIRTPENIERFKSAYAKGGWRALSEERMKVWKEQLKLGRGNLYQLVILTTQLGRKDEAFEYLGTLVDERGEQVVRLKVDPMLDPLRDDPRFDALLKRAGF